MPLTVEWKLLLPEQRQLREREVAGATPESARAMLWGPNVNGVLVIASDSGTSSFEIADELEALILNVCARPLVALTKGQPVEVAYYSLPGELTLTPEGDTIRVSGDTFPAFTFLRGNSS